MHIPSALKFAALTLAAVVALLVATVAVFVYFLDPLCVNEPLSSLDSPNGVYQAVLFQRNCGATTPYSLHVSVLPYGAVLPDEAGNVLIVRDHNLIPRLYWSSPSNLVLEYPAYADISPIQGAPAGVSVQLHALGQR